MFGNQQPFTLQMVSILTVILIGVGITILYMCTCNEEAQPACSPAERLTVTIIEQYPHDSTAFTEGFFVDNGQFIESTGLYGESTLRKTTISDGTILQQIAIDTPYFAEGTVGWQDSVIQLTWKEETALVYDKTTFQKTDEFKYTGEGWGLTQDGTHLIMSNGSSELTFRDPSTFSAIKTITVKNGTTPVSKLNELEYIDSWIFANVWQTSTLIKIHPETGCVHAVIDASNLLSLENKSTDTLNGIAYDPTTHAIYLTGKNWSYVYKINFAQSQY